MKTSLSLCAGAALGLSLASLPTTTARACSCAPPGIVDGEPGVDAEDVPLDVRPWVRAFVDGEDDIVLEDDSGEPVPAAVVVTHGGFGGYDCIASYAEIIPDAPLQPNAIYTIHVLKEVASGPTTRAFVTGTDSIGSRQLDTPAGHLGIVRAPHLMDSCVYTAYRGCVGADGDAATEITVRLDGEVTERFFTRGPKDLVLSEPELADTCVEVRARDLAGNLSEPSVTCAAELTIEEVGEEVDGAALSSCSFAAGPFVQPEPTGQDGDPAPTPPPTPTTENPAPDAVPDGAAGAGAPSADAEMASAGGGGCSAAGGAGAAGAPWLALSLVWARRRRAAGRER